MVMEEPLDLLLLLLHAGGEFLGEERGRREKGIGLRRRCHWQFARGIPIPGRCYMKQISVLAMVELRKHQKGGNFSSPPLVNTMADASTKTRRGLGEVHVLPFPLASA